MLVRRDGLAATMSRYLIDRIEAAANIEVLPRDRGRRAARLAGRTARRRRMARSRPGVETEKPIRNLFLFIGADPATDWLRDCGVALDDKGFIRTGIEVGRCGRGAKAVPALPLQCSVPGVFAVGDVRAGRSKGLAAPLAKGRPSSRSYICSCRARKAAWRDRA